jgi:hypothetical protein
MWLPNTLQQSKIGWNSKYLEEMRSSERTFTGSPWRRKSSMLIPKESWWLWKSNKTLEK